MRHALRNKITLALFLFVLLSSTPYALRNNPVFQRVADYITTNNITKSAIMDVSDAQFLAVMFPPDGIRPAGDYTRISSVKAGLRHVYRERKQAARVQDVILKLQTAYPGVTVESLGNGQYLVTISGDDE